MSGENTSTRRSILRKTGISIGMLLGGSGVASAGDSSLGQHGTDHGGVKVDGGKFMLDVTSDEIDQTTYRLSRVAVDNFNAVIEAGCFSIDSPSVQDRLTTQQAEQKLLIPSEGTTAADIAAVEGVESLNLTVSPDQTREYAILSKDSFTTLSCNKDGIETNRRWVPPEIRVRIYLSGNTITDLTAAAGGGAPSGALAYNYLVKRGLIAAGALSGPVAAVIFAAVAAYWAIIQIQDNGCGVIIKTGVSPLNPLVPTPTVSSQ